MGRELIILVWFSLLVVLVVLVGFLVAAPLWVFGFMFLARHEKLGVSVAVALGLLVFLFGVFDHGMGIELFEGLVFR